MEEEKYISMRYAVKISGLQEHTVRSLCDNNKVKHFRTESGQRRISSISIKEYCKYKVTTTAISNKKNFIYSRVSTIKQEDDPASVGTEG